MIFINMLLCLMLCSSPVYEKGEELCPGISTSSGEETQRAQYDAG